MGLGGSKRTEPSGKNKVTTQSNCKVTLECMGHNFMKIPKFLPDWFFVKEKMSSLFVDEDGDIAHEFYYETFNDENNSSKLVRRVDNLKPLGIIKYSIPRLRSDSPFIIWEARDG
uniref:Ovule protein n=1 Tax=Syphacia muris TaxID=451379 RepID=A0A0N5ADT6_9BILA